MLPATAASESPIDQIYRAESRRVFATLVRLLGDFDLAEEALHDAFAAALAQWPREGIPDQPRAWLVAAGRCRAIDRLRRRQHLATIQAELLHRSEAIAAANADREGQPIEDDRLRLVFTCCHPAIDRQVQIPLTLREVCGLTTEEIASAFLTPPATMAQRLVRGKARIREARIPFEVPCLEELPRRLPPVLAVVYLVFNEGYHPSAGPSPTRVDLSGEAIRLGRLVTELLPEPEGLGLLALMLLHESRRAARTSPDGDLILLEDQDRRRWDPAMIAEGRSLVTRAIRARPAAGPYAIQAAIAAVHSEAATPAATDWRQIALLYDLLLQTQPTPVVELNRAAAIAMRDGPLAGLGLIDQLLARGELTDYHLAHAARADLLRRAGRGGEARAAYEQALALARQAPERRFLRRRIAEL